MKDTPVGYGCTVLPQVCAVLIEANPAERNFGRQNMYGTLENGARLCRKKHGHVFVIQKQRGKEGNHGGK